MPSTYQPPAVHVEQHRRTRTSPRIQPQLPVVVIGPARQIITRASAGTYTAGEELQARFPELAAGALVDSASVELLLDAVDGNGKSLGLFSLSLNTPADAELLSDGESFRVYDTVSLEYSVLSARNNNEPDSITDNDSGSGTPDGIWFTDEQVDFLSRGARVDDSSFIVISQPASVAGRYRIVEFVPTGSRVYTVKVIKVDEDNVPELELDGAINSAALPTSRFLYGFPADHLLGKAAGGGHTSNMTLGTSEGVGVQELLEIAAGKTELAAAEIADILSEGACVIPDQLSGEAIMFSPTAPVIPTDETGSNHPDWQSALTLARVGDWMRFEGDFGGAENEIRDFKITAIDRTDWEVQLQNPDMSGTGTFTLDTAAGTWPDISSIKFLRVLRGSQDAANATGDVLSGDAQGVPFDVEIIRATPGFVELKEELPALSNTVDTAVSYLRGIPYRNVTATYDVTRRISEGFTGDVLCSYKAQRIDLSLNGPIDLASQSEIEEQLGMIHPDNPLALGADMVARSGLPSAGKVFYAVATDGDTLSDFQAALDTLTTFQGYHLVPLTDDEEVIDIFKAHVLSQSLPENKHERIVLGCPKRVLISNIIPSSDNVAVPQGNVSGTIPNRMSTTNPTDIDWGSVQPGMVVKVLSTASTNAAVLQELRIKNVNGALGYCETLEDFDVAYQGATINFKIDTYPLDKSEQAEAWRDEAKAFSSSRVILVRPDECELVYTDKSGPVVQDKTVRLPGYYAAAALAGLKASKAPQAPITNEAVPGITRIFHSDEYFTPDQLNTIAEGGNLIIVQPNRNASPTIRHQLTTDRTSLETQEWSIQHAIDTCAVEYRERFSPFIGKHNITNELLTQLRGIGEAITRDLVNAKILRQGSKLERLYQDTDQPDSVIVEVSLLVPYPCNRITVKLYI